MKIGLVIYGSLDTLSGGYLYDRMLVRELRAAGHTVDVLSLPWRSYPAHLTDNARLRWARKIAGTGYDLLLEDELNHPSLFLLARYWRRSLPCPQVAIVHHLRSSEQHPAWRMPLYRWVERNYLRGVDAFLCNSRTTVDTVRALSGSIHPYHIAYPAADHIDAPPLNVIAARLVSRHSQAGPLRVIFVGNVIPRKGLHHLVAGLAALPASTWTLDIVGDPAGDPAYCARLRDDIVTRGLTPHVAWHGRTDDATLRRRLADADLLAVPSYEGFGIVYLEAMAFGLPVLAARAGAAREIVTHHQNGFLVDPPDAGGIAACLRSLITDRERLAAMSLAARRRFDEHGTWSRNMSLTTEWLHEIRARETTL